MKCNDLDWSEPRICDECGGDVHEHFGDENFDCDYWTTKHCHKCDKSFDDEDFAELKLLVTLKKK